MRPIAPILLSLAVLGTACTGDGQPGATTPDDSTPDERPAAQTSGGVGVGAGFVRLVTFDDCDAVLAHLKREAVARVGAYGLDGNGGWPIEPFIDEMAVDEMAVDMAEEPADEPAFEENPIALPATAADDGDSAEGGAVDFTDTNVQELGVGEPDIVKTDGERIIAISENLLSLVTLTPEPAIADQLLLPEGWNHELFFRGDRAFVLTNGGTWGSPMPIEPMIDAEAEFADDIAPGEPHPGAAGPAALVLEIDLSDPTELEITASMRIEGQYLSARAVDDTVRLAVSSGPQQLPWLYPSSPAGEDRAIEANRETIEQSTLDDWLPSYELTTSDVTDEGSLLACDRIHSPTEFAGFDVVSVVDLDLGTGLGDGIDGRDAVGVLAGGQTVYSSLDRFYVATTSWASPELTRQDDVAEWVDSYTTDIHAFAIAPGEPTQYVASGSVEGSLLNQFSLDEHDGFLRVVTTTGTPWNRSDTSESQLVVLDEDGDTLVRVGRVGGLGKGEQLYAARLLDEVGFAVTFRQVDPFYVIDLSDPTTPAVSGELKIPGYSTYLHPVDDDRVLGIGQDADEFGGIRGLKVSLFDVSDPSDPSEVAVWTLPSANSPAEYDHRAFQMSGSVALLPVQSWGGSFNGLSVLEIGDETITELGRITHQDSVIDDSGCRKLTVDDVPVDSELYWMLTDGYNVVQVCDEDAKGGIGDTSYCDRYPAQELEWMIWDPELAAETVERLDIAPTDRIEFCYPDQDWRLQIQRSLVIGDTIWTMSQRGLQANDAGSFALTSSLPF